jgi:uncharacterized cupredoxin-like copper-binding protein
MKRLTALALLAAVLAVVPVAFGHTSAAKVTTVNVTAKEFRFTLSRRTAPHGIVVFRVINKGRIKHDFKIAGKKTALLRPGGRATLRVRLAKRRYTYVCTVPGHAVAGMKGVFRAT